MLPKDLVVFLEPDDSGPVQRLAYAAELAKRWQAHLIATFVTRPLSLYPYAGFAVGAALSSMLATYQAGTAAEAGRARVEFENLTHDRSFTSEWRWSNDQSGESLMLHARHASLAVLGPPARQRVSTALLGLAEGMLFASGCPCLLLPDDWPAERMARRIVVGWNGGREATRAIAGAMPFLTTADQVHLVVVPDAKVRGLYGQDPGADMATHLARQGAQVELEQCIGDDAGQALLDRCTAIDADLLVVGAIGRSRISEVVYGGATRTLFSKARIPLLLST